MPELTDEQKVAALMGDEEKHRNPLDTTQSTEEPAADAAGAPAEDNTEEPEKPAEGGEASDEAQDNSTFTKQFTNFRGGTWEEYGPELEKAYQNSFTEALRLKKELDERTNELNEARRAIAGMPAGPGAKPDAVQTAVPDLSQIPEVQYIRSIQQRDMRRSFDDFANKYPQVRDEANFNKFRDAATPMGQAFMAAEGREPSYDELFPFIAAAFGWTPADDDARRGSALRETIGQGRSGSGQSKPAPKTSSVSGAQVDAYLRMFPGKNRADALKELQEAVAA